MDGWSAEVEPDDAVQNPDLAVNPWPFLIPGSLSGIMGTVIRPCSS